MREVERDWESQSVWEVEAGSNVVRLCNTEKKWESLRKTEN